MTEAELIASMQPYLEQQLATGRYPIFARALDGLALDGLPEALEPHEQFQFGLDCLLDGIAARIDAARSSAS